MTAWHNSVEYKLQYLLFFAKEVVPKYRPDIQGPMLQADGSCGASFFAIAENKPGSGYEEMEKRTGIRHNLLCGSDHLSHYLPISLGRWFPLDVLCSVGVAVAISENLVILQSVANEVNFSLTNCDSYVGERFGLGNGLCHIAQSIGNPHAVARALLDVVSRFSECEKSADIRA